MTPEDLFQEGRLAAAVEGQVARVKDRPADPAARLFLAELLLFAGDLDRAEKHLDLLAYDDPNAAAAVSLYRAGIRAERGRRDVLAGKGRPKFLGEVPAHAELRLEAIRHYAAGDKAAGGAAADRANAEAPAVRAAVDDKLVEGLRDGDDLFGTCLEVLGSNGEYCWVPMEQLTLLTVTAPKKPVDMIFVPAHLVMRDGSEGDVLLPGLYAGSHESEDDEIRLGRAADWVGDEDAPARGVGGRVLVHSGGHSPLVAVREVAFPLPAAAPGGAES